ncbi:MAG TPA: TIGR02206 family membrane protein [Nocardioidaceae bacterium]|nr:TIGR02206 family membrane protein [Nocardioidaceae bacterium]
MSSNDATEQFTAYGTSHQAALLVLIMGALALVWAGRATRGRAAADRLAKALGGAILLFTLPLQILYLTPAYWELERTLPLQLCDLASLVSAYALFTRRRWAVGLTYFWGLTLTTQAVITPDLASNWPDPAFLLFWAMHLLVVWAAVYLTWGLGLTPDWRTYRTSMALTALWAFTVFFFNLAAGTNYGYLNAKPKAASILDLLGEWPWYVLGAAGVVAVAWALATWPWVALAARAGRRRSPDTAPLA